MAQKLMMDGRRTWLKVYEEPSVTRKAATTTWNLVTDGLGTRLLRSAPMHGAQEAARIEVRRIRQLAAQGVRVPQILAQGNGTLLLSDVGSSLSSRLKAAANEEIVDQLVHASANALVSAHRSGAYFGQAFARNITVSSDNDVGFIDFEEDPLEVMSLADAQARDWLMFAAGVSRYFENRDDALVGTLRQARGAVAEDVAEELDRSTGRLGFLHRGTRFMSHRARAIGRAVWSVRKAFGVLALGLFAFDILLDGDSDIFQFLQGLL